MGKVDVITSVDYYPFGMLARQGKNPEADNYRYNFQGQESDDEVKGKGNTSSYKYRMSDNRLGRFFAVDPLTPKYPHNSPYAFSENRVVDGIELEGLEVLLQKDWEKFLNKIYITNEIEIEKQATETIGKVLITHNYDEMESITFSLNYGGLDDATARGDWGLFKTGYVIENWGWLLRNRKDIRSIQYITHHPTKKALTYALTEVLFGQVIVSNTQGNSFLHLFGSALTTSMFGEETAKWAQDIHEKTPKNLSKIDLAKEAGDKNQERIQDNVKDLINNAWGRSLGTSLAETYNISNNTEWTVELATDYINDVINYWNNSEGTVKKGNITGKEKWVKQWVDALNERNENL